MKCKNYHSWWSNVIVFRLWFYYQFNRILVIKVWIFVVINLSSYLRQISTHCRGILSIDLDQYLEHSILLLHQQPLTNFNLHNKHPLHLFKLCQGVVSYKLYITFNLLDLKLVLSSLFFTWNWNQQAYHKYSFLHQLFFPIQFFMWVLFYQ